MQKQEVVVFVQVLGEDVEGWTKYLKDSFFPLSKEEGVNLVRYFCRLSGQTRMDVSGGAIHRTPRDGFMN